MSLRVSLADVDTLKNSLNRELQQVKSGHVVEALARGLGWNTYAAMRAGLCKGVQVVATDGAAFIEFLEARGYREVDPGVLQSALRRILNDVAPRS